MACPRTSCDVECPQQYHLYLVSSSAHRSSVVDSMRVWPLTLVLVLVMLTVCSAPELNAQTTASGALAGVVNDQSGAVVPDAEIEIRDNAKGTTQSLTSDREGAYQFSFLAPGRYTLTVNHSGFREEKRTVNVLLGPAVSVNVTLALLEAHSEITVEDEAPFIQAENGDAAATMNQTQISETPNPGNDLTYVVQSAPGVVMNTDTPSDSHFSILGMPGTSYRFTSDGMNGNGPSNTASSGVLGLLLGQNAIQEATVVSTGYSGQFGGAAGGNINYITKSGTKDLHGNAQYYWNGSVLNANYWFNNAFQVPRPFEIANQWAGSLGGPIKKGKLFFFLDSEGLRLQVLSVTPLAIPSPEFKDATLKNIADDARFGRDSATYAFYHKIFDLYDSSLLGAGIGKVQKGVNGSLGCADFVDPRISLGDLHGLGRDVPCAISFVKDRSRPSHDALTSGRIDWNAGTTDRVFFRLQRDGGVNAAYNDPISPVFDFDSLGSWWQGDVVETHTFSPSFASQFLAGVSSNSTSFGVEDLAKSLATFPTGLYFNGTLPFFKLGNSGITSETYTLYQFSGDLVKTWGNHNIRFGLNLERTHWNRHSEGFSGAGYLNPESLMAFFQGGIDPANPNADFTLLTQSFPSGSAEHIATYSLGLYGQDEWHVRKNLSLTLALRAELQANPVCENRCFARLGGTFDLVSHDPEQPYRDAISTNQKHAFAQTDDVLWSPRIGFAWQPFGLTHNTVLRGGLGIFYDPVTLFLAHGLSVNPPMLNQFNAVRNNLTPGEPSNLFNDAAVSNKAFRYAFNAGESLVEIQQTIPNFLPPNLNAPESKIHSPQYQRWSLELQQALGVTTSFSVGYFGHHGIHELVGNSAANAFGFGSLPTGRCSDAIPDCAPDPRFAFVTDFATVAVSNYNGVVASLKHRMSRWSPGLLEVNYSYGHALDEVSNGGIFGFTAFSVQGPQNPRDLHDAYASADYDVRHSLNANYVLELPLKSAFRGHGPKSLLDGWQVSGTFFAHTGFPYTVFDDGLVMSLATKNYFGEIYAVPARNVGPQLPCGAAAAILPGGVRSPCQPPQTVSGSPNQNANFLQSGCETDFNRGKLPGNAGPCSGPEVSFAQRRNQFRGPGYFSTDLTIMKSTNVPRWENAVLRIGFQFFNVLNHPNFGLPFIDSSSELLGVIGYMAQSNTSLLGNAKSNTTFLGTSANGSARMIQLKAELKF